MAAPIVCPCLSNWRTGEYHINECIAAKKLRDSWCSPTEVTERLPEVRLDPASNPRSTVKARINVLYHKAPIVADQVMPEPTNDPLRLWTVGDGLMIPWNESIYLNGPYSGMLPFADKANEEWGANRLKEAIFLVKLDPTTKWWKRLTEQPWARAIEVWLFNKRLQHVPPPRIKASTNNFASAIIHWRRPVALYD